MTENNDVKKYDNYTVVHLSWNCDGNVISWEKIMLFESSWFLSFLYFYLTTPCKQLVVIYCEIFSMFYWNWGIFYQIVLKMCWKCDKCKKKLEEEITFSSQFSHYVMKFIKFSDLSYWAKLWSLYLITLWWKCDENVMNCIWYSFFGSYHLKIPASQKTSCSFTMTMNNEPSILS